MATFFISDTHFGHGNIIKYCRRPFLNESEQKLLEEESCVGDRQSLPASKTLKVSYDSVSLMDKTIVDNINAVVGENDVLWHLGDFCFGDYPQARSYRERINCRTVNLIRGNHDKDHILSLFSVVHDQTMITADGARFFLNHYPMLSWNGAGKGVIHLHGHVHGTLGKKLAYKPILDAISSLDVGVDGPEGLGSPHAFRPWSVPEIKRHFLDRQEI